MSTTTMTTGSARADTHVPSSTGRSDPRLPRRWRPAVLAVPALWAIVALVHPMGGEGTVYEGLRDDVGLWVGIHLAQLLLSAALAVGLWGAVAGLHSPAARIARASIPVYLVFFGAFDAIVGIATGLVVHHANSTTGATREGAISTADYLMWNPIAGNTGIIWAIATTALVGAILGTAMALRRAGAARGVWMPILAGLLLATHAGPAAAGGALALGVGFHRWIRKASAP